MRDIVVQVTTTKKSTNRSEAPQQAGRLDDQLCFALYAATNAVTRVYRPLLKDIGLTYPQYLVLLILWERGPQQVGEIAGTLHLATHAVSPILDRLEESGLVRRVKDDTDGRVVRAELTRTGRALEAKAAAVQEEVRCSTMLDADEVNQLRADLKALLARMGDE
jgi:DNA-binding MarR family transcriptional regulator